MRRAGLLRVSFALAALGLLLAVLGTAAVAGPGREINEALTYLWQLYPDRLVEVGYVDVGGAENARVVNGVALPAGSLSRDVRAWPSFRQGITTPVGTASISAPFLSPT